jgi:hypothetical protein
MKMLVNKKTAKGDIVSFKILNGDELIARVISVDDDGYIFNHPMALSITPQGPGVVPWIMLGDNTSVPIKYNHIFSLVPAKLDAAEQYLDHLENPKPFMAPQPQVETQQ